MASGGSRVRCWLAGCPALLLAGSAGFGACPVSKLMWLEGADLPSAMPECFLCGAALPAASHPSLLRAMCMARGAELPKLHISLRSRDMCVCPSAQRSP